jgi:hypothetical protein
LCPFVFRRRARARQRLKAGQSHADAYRHIIEKSNEALDPLLQPKTPCSIDDLYTSTMIDQ